MKKRIYFSKIILTFSIKSAIISTEVKKTRTCCSTFYYYEVKMLFGLIIFILVLCTFAPNYGKEELKKAKKYWDKIMKETKKKEGE